jgi:PGF-CTERM protein
MISNRPPGRVLTVVIAVVLASLLVPGVFAQQTGQPEDEPNDSPQNATFVRPGTSISGQINSTSTNVSQADADWFAFPVQKGQNVTVSFESGNDAERVLVFLAGPNGSQNVSAVNDTLADATIAPPGSTVGLNTTVVESRIYFVGVTGLNGEYEATIETSSEMTMNQNGTNMTDGTNVTNGTATANASSATTETTAGVSTTTNTATPTDTTTETSTTPTVGSGGESGGGDSSGSSGNADASGQGTSASGPGFGLLAMLVALLAAALFILYRR